MNIESLKLYNFRNYDSFSLNPSPHTTVIYGKNGSGKTNLLEAIHFCCFGRSHRTRQDRDLLNFTQKEAMVNLKTLQKDGKHDVRLTLQTQPKTQKMVYVMGKKIAKMSDMFGHSTCVLFAPEDLQLIKEAPQERRRFMDMQMTQMNPTYLATLSNYLKALKSRNALLKMAAFGHKVDDELDVWEAQMAPLATKMVEERGTFVQALGSNAQSYYRQISQNPSETLSLCYEPCMGANHDFLTQWRNDRMGDTKHGATHVGPHKDELMFYLNGHPMKEYASQGQIRTAILAVKLTLIHMIEQKTLEKPILLLDDVFSELDVNRRQALIEVMNTLQTFITCTDRSDLAHAKVDGFLKVENSEGKASVSVES